MRTARDGAVAQAAARELPKLLHMELMNRDIFSAPRCQFAVSTPMSEHEIDAAAKVMGKCLKVVKPYVEAETPHLLRD